MNAPLRMLDAQAALGFVLAQRTTIEGPVLRRPLPEIRYPALIPVDTSPPPFTPSVTFFTADPVGRAKFVNGKADDIPYVDVQTSKYEQTVNMAAVAYEYSLEEIGAAQQFGYPLDAEKAMVARMAYERLVDDVAFTGDTQLGIEGLYNTTGITSVAAAQTFAAATPAQALATINTALSGVLTGSNGMEQADTVVLPIAVYADLATRQLAPESTETILSFVQRANVYTTMTGRPLTIVADYRLTNTMVVYRRDPSVLKLIMPMPLRFIPPQAYNLMIRVIGMFRFAPLSIRRPAAVRYTTGIA